MSEPSPLVCTFSEGAVTLPSGCRDNTVNAFVPQQPGGAGFNIARDRLEPAETLDAYVERQLKLMRQHLPAWNQQPQRPTVLGAQALSGFWVQASYQRGEQRIDQVQAVFSPAAGQVLVFTVSRAGRLDSDDLQRFEALLASFVATA